MTTADFKEGKNVVYIPPHAQGDINHKDCEIGVVSSVNEKFVYVKYVRNSILQQTSQATNPKDLRK
jgi:hypothetical protein